MPKEYKKYTNHLNSELKQAENELFHNLFDDAVLKLSELTWRHLKKTSQFFTRKLIADMTKM